MKLSFVIPAYNEEKIIGKCLDSIERELARGSYNAEIVVVNNASTDKTREVASARNGVRVIDEPRKGLVRARAAGFFATSGELVANVDSDTMLPEGWIETVFKEFERNPHLVALSGPFIYYDLSLFDRSLVKIFYAFGYFFYFVNHFIFRSGAMLQGGNFVLRRSAWEKAGGFDTNIEFYGEDTDVARRIGKVGRVKWTFKLPMYASGRRLAHEGLVRIGTRYAINFFWTTYAKKPFTKDYTDIRPQ